MTTKVGINGFGRIGRQVFKAIGDFYPDTLEVVAANDIGDVKTMAHLLKYDSNYGKFDGTVEVTDEGLLVDGKLLKILAERVVGYERQFKARVVKPFSGCTQPGDIPYRTSPRSGTRGCSNEPAGSNSTDCAPCTSSAECAPAPERLFTIVISVRVGGPSCR